MKTVLIYLLQVMIASAILYGYYHLALRNKRFHQYNRFYLLAAAIIPVLVPFVNIPVYFSESAIQSSVVLQTLQNISSTGPGDEATITPASMEVSTPFNWNMVLYGLYALAALLLLARILVSLKKIIVIIKNNPVKEIEGIRFVNTLEPGTPYSFFRWLFWNKKIELRSEKGEQIFLHEIYHIQQRHSIDILFMELLTVVFWINPFFHIMKKEIKAIHEFLADEFAAHKTEKWGYAELLLMQALNTRQHLVNPFFHNQIKRRITMITNPEKTSHRYLRKLLVLPVAAIVLSLVAFTYKNKHTGTGAGIRAVKTVTIVVDAGHGGTDPGAQSPDQKYSEARITLQIAKTIQRLAKEYNVQVVMTRENDHFPGNVATKDAALKKRIEISETTKPAAFISVHMNAATGDASGKSGFDAYVSGKKKDPGSKTLASAILQNLSSVYPARDQSMERHEAGVYVLDKNNYPAVLLQCGYMTNAADLAFISQPGNQEKLARSILTAVVSYQDQLKENILITDTIPGKTGRVNGKPDSVVGVKVKMLPKKEDGFSTPLIVIDGVVKGNTDIAELDGMINPNDIESINILKGSKAADRYGDKGRSGVIEINTKKKKDQKPAEVQLEDSEPQGSPDKVFTKAEIDPSFPGGEMAWKKYLEKNLNPLIPSQKGAPNGTYTVYVQLIVQTDGSISGIKAFTNHGFGMEEEVMRVISKGPKWNPAIQNGRKVNAYWKQPVTFFIADDNKTKQKTSSSGSAETGNQSNIAGGDFSDPEFRKQRQMAISEVAALARAEGKAAYEYKGRTYIFARIINNDPQLNTFGEQDGTGHSFLLNGRLVNSIAEINQFYQREDISAISLVSKEESKRKYNLDALLSIETVDKGMVTQK